MNASRPTLIFGWLVRVSLFVAAASLAVYIPYKYATQLHAVQGFYAFLFPLSALLAVAGMIVAVKPASACDCGTTLRTGVGALSVLWLATGVMCVGSLTEAVIEHPLHGSIASFHMLAQHVFLSIMLIAVALNPKRMASVFGASADERHRPVVATAAL